MTVPGDGLQLGIGVDALGAVIPAVGVAQAGRLGVVVHQFFSAHERRLADSRRDKGHPVHVPVDAVLVDVAVPEERAVAPLHLETRVVVLHVSPLRPVQEAGGGVLFVAAPLDPGPGKAFGERVAERALPVCDRLSVLLDELVGVVLVERDVLRVDLETRTSDAHLHECEDVAVAHDVVDVEAEAIEKVGRLELVGLDAVRHPVQRLDADVAVAVAALEIVAAVLEAAVTALWPCRHLRCPHQ